MKKTCAVIGAGLGGLAAAIRLASDGYAVDLYEKGERPGGKANVVRGEGFRFDTGPSIVTMPFVLEALFRDSGDDITRHIDIQPLAEHCRYFYGDGTVISAHRGVDDFAAEIESKTADRGDDVRSYLEYCRVIYDLTADLFLFNDFHELSTFMENPNAAGTLRTIWKIDPLRSVHRANASYFRDPRTLQLFDRYATYNGSDPFKAPATLNIIPHVEYNMGSFIIKQGIYGLVEAMVALARRAGVSIQCNTPVDSIEHAGGRVTGVRAGGELRPYSVIVSNADVSETYTRLLNDTKSKGARRYRKLEPSSSAVVFYWGVRGVHNDIGIHNILFSDDYRSEFRHIFDQKRCPDDPTVYAYISSRFKKDDAPDGCENWFVMINAPYNDPARPHEEQYDIPSLRAAVLKRIKKNLGIDLSGKIIFERTATPFDIERNTASCRGSIYGISSNSRGAAFWRQPVRSRDYRGLYFCGGSSHPGGGIPLVVLSGAIAAGLIRKYEG